jgi:DNA-binding NtrC family response regulator
VLIIAEDAVAREVYAELFAMRGYGVVTAIGARDGLKRARERIVTTVVLVLQQGAAQLRRKLHAMRPTLRIHVSGLSPLCFDVMAPLARQQLH